MTELLSFLAFAVLFGLWLRYRDRRRFDEMVGKTVEELEIEARHRLPKIIAISCVTGLGIVCSAVTANHLISTVGLQAATHFIGGPVVVSTGGGGASGTPSMGAPDPPATPVVSATVVNDAADSLALSTTAYDGDGADAHDSTAFQVDTAGGDFSTPQYHDVVLGAVLVDTAVSVDSGAVVDVRARHRGEDGGWGGWDTLSAVEMTRTSITVHFFSDFSNATGSSEAAWGDGGKWSTWLSGTRTVTSSPTCSGFPTTNVLTIAGSGANITSSAMYSAPSVGDTVALRYYICITNIGSGDGEYHGIYFNDGSSGWGPTTMGYYTVSSGGGYDFMLSSNTNGQGGSNDSRYFGPESGGSMVTVSEDVVYREEAIYVRTGATTYTMRRRLYDSDGTLLYDNFCDGYWANCTTLSGGMTGEPVLDDAVFDITGAGASAMRFLTFGNNDGPSGEYGGVAVCSSWCGPYPIDGVENQ